MSIRFRAMLGYLKQHISGSIEDKKRDEEEGKYKPEHAKHAGRKFYKSINVFVISDYLVLWDTTGLKKLNKRELRT